MATTILCGTDFSFHANQAAQAAAAIAARLRAKLVLAHVLDRDLYHDASPEFLRSLRARRLRRLEMLAERISTEAQAPELVVVEGTPAAKLAELAANFAVRFLVVSTAGQILPGQWFSSVTDQTVVASCVPSLVLRNSGLMRSWLAGERPLRVAVAHDGSDHGDSLLAWAASLDEIAPCDVTVFHVAPASREQLHPARTFTSYPAYSSSAIKQLLGHEFRRRCDARMGGDRARVLVRTYWSRPDAKLIEMARENRSDLLIVGRGSRRTLASLGSVSRFALHHAPMNVACVPERVSQTSVQAVRRNMGIEQTAATARARARGSGLTLS